MAKLSGLSERLELASTLVTDGKLDESSAVCRDLEESIRQSLKEATSQSERVMLERLKRANTVRSRLRRLLQSSPSYFCMAQAMIEKVKKLELQQRRNGRERFTGPVSKVDCGARQDFSDLTFSDGNAAVDQQLVQQFHSTNLELREREVLVDQRTTELMKVERDVVALNECMRDIGELVQQQGETLGENGVIFCHLEEARSRSVDAAQQFAKAGRSRYGSSLLGTTATPSLAHADMKRDEISMADH
eukprot:756481-Hanusia_phi.AAC.5